MASTAFFTWVADGKPYRLTTPALEFKGLLSGYGYVVYDYPNEEHQRAVPPEDHTPYSATEWPIRISAYIGHAVDVMEPGALARARGAVPLPVLARQIIADRDAGKPGTMWIKYMNWTDENGVCRHESWKGGARVTTSSTDKGHIHISGRTDTQTYHIGDWNPVMSLTNEQVAWLYNASSIAAAEAGMLAKAPTKKNDGTAGAPIEMKNVAALKDIQAALDAVKGTLAQIQTALGELTSPAAAVVDYVAVQAASKAGTKDALREGVGQ